MVLESVGVENKSRDNIPAETGAFGKNAARSHLSQNRDSFLLRGRSGASANTRGKDRAIGRPCLAFRSGRVEPDAQNRARGAGRTCIRPSARIGIIVSRRAALRRILICSRAVLP